MLAISHHFNCESHFLLLLLFRFFGAKKGISGTYIKSQYRQAGRSHFQAAASQGILLVPNPPTTQLHKGLTKLRKEYTAHKIVSKEGTHYQ